MENEKIATNETPETGESGENKTAENKEGATEFKASAEVIKNVDDNNHPAWFYDLNMPGKGEKPEYLEEGMESIVAQAKQYKSLKEKRGDAPESYNVDLEGLGLQADERINKLVDLAKENHIPQSFLDSALKLHAEIVTTESRNMQAEKDSLSAGENDRLKVISSNMRERLGEEKFNKIAKSVKSPKALLYFSEFVASYLGDDKINPKLKINQKVHSKEELYKMITDKRYQGPSPDLAYVDHVERLWKQAHAANPNIFN